MHRPVADFAKQIPQGEIDRRCRPVFDSGRGLRHWQGDHLLVERLDAQRILPKQTSGERVVNMGLDRAHAIEGFAESGDPGVGLDLDP